MPSGPGINTPGMEPSNGRRVLDVSALSSQQRSALLEAMHAQLNLLITQVNALTRQVNDLNHRTANTYADVRAVESEISELTSSFVGHRGLMARLRWLVLGR